jgi:nitric oxide reductase NorE protein
VTLEGQATEADLPDFLWPDVEDGAQVGLGRRTTTPDSRSGDVPGEPGLWIFILGDMTLFGAIFTVLMWERRFARTEFHRAALELSRSIGMVNTLTLLLSSYLVVAATWAHRRDDHVRSSRLVLGALGCALIFAILKAVEYSYGIASGHTPTTNLFFTFYFVLTGAHVLHVVIGAGLLAAWWGSLRRRMPWNSSGHLMEGAAVYWHMVDLLWIAIFTLVYLACAG